MSEYAFAVNRYVRVAHFASPELLRLIAAIHRLDGELFLENERPIEARICAALAGAADSLAEDGIARGTADVERLARDLPVAALLELAEHYAADAHDRAAPVVSAYYQAVGGLFAALADPLLDGIEALGALRDLPPPVTPSP